MKVLNFNDPYVDRKGDVNNLGDVLSGTSVDLKDYAKKTDIPTTLPANGGNADTVNNHTVKIDVPENAVFTDTIYDDTKVKEDISKLNSNLSKTDMQLRNYNNEVNISPEMKEAIESSFTSTSDYSIFSGLSNTQEEGCWYGYKHTNTLDCYFTFYTHRFGILAGKRSSNGIYSFRYLSKKW